MNLIYTYDPKVVDSKSTSGKFLVTLAKRGNVKYSSISDDIRHGLKTILNQLCFDNDSKELFITLSEHSNPNWINIKLKKGSQEYILQITDINSMSRISINEIAVLLS